MNRRLTFSAEERKRLAFACQALGTTFEEFVHEATLQALDEFEADIRQVMRRNR